MTLTTDRIKSIRPLYDRVLIQRLSSKETTTPGGLVIPDQAKERPQIGFVIATGNGKFLNGSIQPLLVKTGDQVFFGKYAGTELGEDFIILKEEEILGIL